MSPTGKSMLAAEHKASLSKLSKDQSDLRTLMREGRIESPSMGIIDKATFEYHDGKVKRI